MNCFSVFDHFVGSALKGLKAPSVKIIWDIVFKNGPSKICGRQPLKNSKGYGLRKADYTPLNFFKAVFRKFYLVHSWKLTLEKILTANVSVSRNGDSCTFPNWCDGTVFVPKQKKFQPKKYFCKPLNTDVLQTLESASEENISDSNTKNDNFDMKYIKKE